MQTFESEWHFPFADTHPKRARKANFDVCIAHIACASELGHEEVLEMPCDASLNNGAHAPHQERVNVGAWMFGGMAAINLQEPSELQPVVAIVALDNEAGNRSP
jgi:hypothetical protein